MKSHFGLGSVWTKLISLVLCTSILLTPVGPVFAAFGGGSPTIPNSSVFGTSVEDPKIDGATGAFTQRVPLDTPPGRNGLQPAVSLDYNNQRTKDSIVGYGWSLSVRYIERENKTGSQDLYGNTPYFTSSTDGELALATSSPSQTPSILDTTPLTVHAAVNAVSDSFSYGEPAGGSNKVFVVLMGKNDATNLPTAMTLNGTALTQGFVNEVGGTLAGFSYGYLVAPPSGTSTFSVSFGSNTYADYVAFTLQNISQSSPLDKTNAAWTNSGSSQSVSTSTGSGDLLLSYPWFSRSTSFSSFGPGETSFVTEYNDANFGSKIDGSWKIATSSGGSESMAINISSGGSINEPMLAITPSTQVVGGVSTTTAYPGTR